jgi:glycosyltransferase involved in cell wall biosynthesis
MPPLKILHVFRAPVGGLFRHVVDLAREQTARGHAVGLLCDRNTGGERAETVLRALEPSLALGVTRIPMRRHGGIGDAMAVVQTMRRIKQIRPDVIHGHGAKGGAYARLALNAGRALKVYTPHGGSLWIGQDSLAGKIYAATERLLIPRTGLFLFESAFSANAFARSIGDVRGRGSVVHNGVGPEEFEPVALAADATDLLFMGELRLLKGVDVIIDALAALHGDGRTVTLTVVGDGGDRAQFVAQVQQLGLSGAVTFLPAMPARQAQALGRVMLVASRAESLPYVVLEAAAAAKPLIATRVGGIPEIYGPLGEALIPAGDPQALAIAIAHKLDDPAAALAKTLQARVKDLFSITAMVDGVLAGYRDALAARQMPAGGH